MSKVRRAGEERAGPAPSIARVESSRVESVGHATVPTLPSPPPSRAKGIVFVCRLGRIGPGFALALELLSLNGLRSSGGGFDRLQVLNENSGKRRRPLLPY